MNLLKVEIRIEHKNVFCGPSKIFRNISWPINICLKYFMTPAPLLHTKWTVPNGNKNRFGSFLDHPCHL